jgi:Uma2 family endonuclease
MRQNHSSHHPLGNQCQNQRVEIYRQSQGVEVLDAPQTLSGEAVLPGFVLDLAEMVSE